MASSKNGIWGLIDRFKGDKVILIIALLLIMISIVSVFSSTPLLALMTGSSRLSIVLSQLVVAAAGLALIFVCYAIRNIRFYQLLSMGGFLFSLTLLILLVAKVDTPFLRSAEFNDARRVLVVFGMQVHVYEIVKIVMVMYLAWAVHAFRKGQFSLTKSLAKKYRPLRFMGSPFFEKMVYIYLPILVITGLVFLGSNSSAVILAFIMLMTVFVGGVGYRDILIVTAAAALAGAAGFWGYKSGMLNLSDTRADTAMSRLTHDDKKTMQVLLAAKPNSPEYNEAADRLKQPVGALLAIKEGGIFGKGPGRSTQRYVVPLMFGDYMYSFLIEEYGLLGGILVLILYVSLLARGAIIARKCSSTFAKTAVAGLVLLITAQAFMHMAVNVHIIPQTGQTLPLISHGSTSFMMFSLAFGIILSISRMAQKQVEREAERLGSIVEMEDEVRESLNDLESLENRE